MILENPTSRKTAEKAYEEFHFGEPDSSYEVWVPKSYPKKLVMIGFCEMFEVRNSNGSKVKRNFLREDRDNMPFLAMSGSMKDLFILGDDLRIPSGRALQVDYRLPDDSPRNEMAKRWYHPQDTQPRVIADRSGRAVKVTGPGLHINERGIIG